jgi:enamine deaminase RidA (YjgF/YER057c/UK114 family)
MCTSGSLARSCLDQWKIVLLGGSESAKVEVVTSIEGRLIDLGIDLPAPSPPLATYVPVRLVNEQAYVSGHGPLDRVGRPLGIGDHSDEFGDVEAEQATRVTIINLLASLKDGLGSLDRVLAVLQVRCFLAVPGRSLNVHAKVAEVAGRLLSDVFGSLPIAQPTTVGVGSCALGLRVTIDLIIDVSPIVG